MLVHTVSVTIAVVQFVSYVLLSTCLQYVYYYRRAHQPERWKSQPSRLRVVSTTAGLIAPAAPLPASPAAFTFTSTSDEPSCVSTTAHSTFLAVTKPSSLSSSTSVSSLRRWFVCWAYPAKWLLFPSLPRVPHRHPHQALITTFNLTMSSCMAGCVTEAFMHGRSSLTSHTHFLPALALPASFFPSASHPSLPHVLCTLLVSILWQYYWHRMQHLPFFYRHCHKLHHYYQSPQPFDDLMIHPLEAFGYYLILFSPAFLVPQSVLSFALYMSVMGVCGVLDHCGVDVRVLGVYDAREHDEHHRLFNVNYSFPFPFMDRLHGTYRAPADLSVSPHSADAAAGKAE